VKLARIVVAVGLLLAGVGLVLTLTASRSHLAGSNDARPFIWAAGLPAGGELCQMSGPVPEDGRRLRLLTGSEGAPLPEIELLVRSNGRATAAGRLPAGAREGLVDIPLSTAPAADTTEVCLRNKAPARPATCESGRLERCVLISGETATGSAAATRRGQPQAGRIRLEWLREGRESWLALAPDVARRFGYGKGDYVGPWGIFLCALLVCASWILAIRLLLRKVSGA
jgi:hypothetical protein